MPSPAPITSEAAQRTLAQMSQAIKTQRKNLGISAVSAAQSAGISRVTLHRIETNAASVTAGAVIGVIDAIGLSLYVRPNNDNATAVDSGAATNYSGWLPVQVHLSQYPVLKQLAWHIQGNDALTPQQAWEVYTRHARHIEPNTVSPSEQNLIDALKCVFGD
jgi:DNA-binding phage protein